MSIKFYFKLFALFAMISYIDSEFLKESILNEKFFNLEARCAIPMLGSTLADFQISKNSHVVALVDIDKNFKDMGISNDSETNPENIKSLNVVFRKDLNKLGMFWTNTKNEVFTTRPSNQITEIVSSCALWLKDFLTIVKDFEMSISAPLEKDEAKFGNNKFIFDNEKEEVKYGYIFQDDKLTALTQERPQQYALLANLITFVNSSTALSENELIPIPEGIDYQIVDN